MTTLIFPNIAPMRQRWGLITPSVIAPQSPQDGTFQTVSYPGARWKCTLDFPPLHDSVRGARQARSQLKAFLTACRGHANAFWLFDRGNDLLGNTARGTFPRENVITNGYFDESISGWNTEGAAKWAHGWILLRSTGTGQARIWQQCTVRDGAHYVARVHGWTLARNDSQVVLRVGTTAHANDLLADVQSSPSLAKGDHFDLSGTFTASGTTAFVEVEQLTNTPTSCMYTAFELIRCPHVTTSPDSTASVLTVDQWKAPEASAQDSLLYVGDMLEVAGELKRSTATVFSDGAGRAWVPVEPPMRALPADNTPVILYRPRGCFILATPQAEWEDAIERYSGFSIECIEHYERLEA